MHKNDHKLKKLNCNASSCLRIIGFEEVKMAPNVAGKFKKVAFLLFSGFLLLDGRVHKSTLVTVSDPLIFSSTPFLN